MSDRFMASVTAGDAAFRKGDVQTARAELGRALDMRASHPPLLKLYAECCRRTGETEAERQALRRLVLLTPGDTEAAERLAALAAETGRDADLPFDLPESGAGGSRGLLGRLFGRRARPAVTARDPLVQLDEALERYDMRTAAALVEPLLATQGNRPGVQMAAARIALAQGRYPAASAHAAQAREAGETGIEARALQIRAAAMGDRFDEAQNLLDGLTPQERATVPAKLAEATLFYETDRPDAALGLLDEVEALGDAPALAAELRARLLAGRGEFEAARPVLETWASRAPTSGAPHIAAAENRLFRPGSALFDMAQALVRNPEAGPGSRAAVHFALARACKDAGDHEAEFAHLDWANALADAFYDPWTEAERDAAIRSAFDAARCAEAQDETRGAGMIFICGLPRSGSTLVAQVLAAHPEAVSIGESQIFPDLLGTLTGYPEAVAARDPGYFADLGRAYLDALPPKAKAARFVVDKELAKFRHLGLLHLMLPGARILHTRRDPMDVCHSVYGQNFAGWPATFRLETLAHFHHLHDDMMAHWDRVLPGRIHHVDYEAIVAEPETEIRALLEASGVPFHEACLDFQAADTVVRTASVFQVRQGLYSSSVGAWRRHEARMEPLRRGLENRPFGA